MSRILLGVVLAVVACKGGSGSARDSSAAGGSSVASGSVPSLAPADAAIAAPVGKVIKVVGQVTVRGKPLAVGDAVAADDVIETDSHGRVVVLLPIDDSQWELGPNQQAKVGEAKAWTVLTDAGTGTQDAGASTDAAAAPPPKKPPAPKPPAPHPEVSDSGGHISGATVGQAKINSDAAADLIGRQESALRRCLSAHARVQIHILVNDAGNVSTSIDGASSAAVSTCLKGVIAKVKLAPAKASVNMMIENGSQ
jgi:hypothetical protein